MPLRRGLAGGKKSGHIDDNPSNKAGIMAEEAYLRALSAIIDKEEKEALNSIRSP